MIELLRYNRLVSSAKWWTLHNFIAWSRSFMYNKDRSGPRPDPWGTPQFIIARPDSYPFVDTYWLRLDKQDLKQSFKTPQIPLRFNCASSIWWSTVSKAFCKSAKTPQPIFPPSNAFLIFSVILIKAWDVEYRCLVSAIEAK